MPEKPRLTGGFLCVQGKLKGISEGSYKAKLETAKILKQFGDSVQKIVQATGLTEAEVERL